MFWSSRPVVLCAALTCGLFAAPAQADACWLLHGLFGHGQTTYRPIFPTTTYYAPTTAYYAPTTAYYAPSSSCCGTQTSYYAPAQQTCNYVPVTTYRPQVVNRPVVTYRPVTTYDRCTSCPVTSYMPVTGYVSEVQYRATTSYRLDCNTCYTPPANNCCVPNSSYPSTIPATEQGDTGVPQLAPGQGTPQDTFRQNSGDSTNQPTKALKPIPDANTNGAGNTQSDDGSSLILQDPSNRTAQASTGWQIRTAVSHESELSPRVIPAVDQKPAESKPVAKTSNDGWRAAKKN